MGHHRWAKKTGHRDYKLCLSITSPHSWSSWQTKRTFPGRSSPQYTMNRKNNSTLDMSSVHSQHPWGAGSKPTPHQREEDCSRIESMDSLNILSYNTCGLKSEFSDNSFSSVINENYLAILFKTFTQRLKEVIFANFKLYFIPATREANYSRHKEGNSFN